MLASSETSKIVSEKIESVCESSCNASIKVNYDSFGNTLKDSSTEYKNENVFDSYSLYDCESDNDPSTGKP